MLTEERAEELNIKIIMILGKMEKAGVRMADEMAERDVHALESYKEFMKLAGRIGPIIKELVS